MRLIFEGLYGRRIRRESGKYLRELATSQVAASRRNADELVRSLKANSDQTVAIGTTPWGHKVQVPLAEIVKAFGLVGGATESGKSSVGLLLVQAILKVLTERQDKKYGLGILDAKGDLFRGALFLFSELERTHPQAAQELRERMCIINFAPGHGEPLSPYNVLARWPGIPADVFAAQRGDLFLGLLPGPDKLNLGASGVLKRMNWLLTESSEPITRIVDVVEDERFRTRLLARCRNPLLTAYFARQYPRVPKATFGAILRRLDALVSCESVQRVLSGDSAPDFRRLQDEGKIVLINCSGQGVPQSVRRFLQSLVFLDLTSAVFARQETDVDFVWFCDEAQQFLATEQLREATSEIACTARTWHTHFAWFTQNVSTAVQDPRVLKILHTNIGWSLTLRSDPADCVHLKAALPLTGRRPRPQSHPFAEHSFYSEAEERAIIFEEIASLPNRSAYLWLKKRAAQALPIRTADMRIPESKELRRVIADTLNNPAIGMRLSYSEYDRRIAEREAQWDCEGSEPGGDLAGRLKRAYQENRGHIEA